MRRVVITGIGIVSSIGNDVDEVTQSLMNGVSGIISAPDYAELGFRSQVKGAVIAMQNLLSLGDLNEITSVMYPDFSDWKWSEYEIAEAKKIWSIK